MMALIAYTLESCYSRAQEPTTPKQNTKAHFRVMPSTPGAFFIDRYLDIIQEKKVGLVVNQTSLTDYNQTHLVDTLKSLQVNITTIFAPEHGFRGTEDAGAHIQNSVDTKTNIPIISLYGKHYKPTQDDLNNVETVVFDIQDVGTRFYTYISTLHYVMEACAEQNIPLIVLDRPNPNGHYVDGPVLRPAFKSFVGMHPVPIVYGMTIGEYAKMINGEKWLANGVQCNLTVIACEGYSHERSLFMLQTKPSPNLPNVLAIYLYPSLCWFEGTDISVGRGTDKPFQCYGSPSLKNQSYTFTVEKKSGAMNPPHVGKLCYGADLSKLNDYEVRNERKLNLTYLIQAYKNYSSPTNFFLKNNFFDKLAGSDVLRKQIINKTDEKTIRKSWEKDGMAFKKIRKKYLLYKDFE